MESIKNEFGSRLRGERKRTGLARNVFSELVGCHESSQKNYEINGRLPNTEYLKKAAELGLDIHYIITGERDETRIKTDQEMAYVALCRELPTPEARDLGMDAIRLVLKTWQPGSAKKVGIPNENKDALEKSESLVDKFSRIFYEVLAPVYSSKKEPK